MTTATAPRTIRRTAGQSAEQRRARQDELLATLADGVLELTTSQGWRRYLRAMATLRKYSTGNSQILKPRELLLHTPDRRCGDEHGLSNLAVTLQSRGFRSSGNTRLSREARDDGPH